jgi:hypothetical protein
MVHVAVAAFVDPVRVALDVVHAVTLAVPETLNATMPLGVAPLLGPVTVAVKTMLPPSAVTLLLVTALVGVALATVTVLADDDVEVR